MNKSRRWSLHFAALFFSFALMLLSFQNCSQISGFSLSASDDEAGSLIAGVSTPSLTPTPTPTPTATGTPTPTPAPPTFTAFGLSSSHRYKTGTMSGGWGAHLGHLLRSSTNQLWYVDDTGADPNVNAGLIYYRFANGVWTGTAAATFPGRVQQNSGSLMVGQMIFTYGLDVQNKKMIECYFDASDASFATHACNQLPFDTGTDSNYIGATTSKSGTRVVWWTNTTGTFSYIYDFGGGWNGPITSALGGYTDFSYVYARIADSNTQIEFLGSAARASGGASVGYDVVHANASLGSAPTNWALMLSGGVAMETWRDPKGGTHFFAYGSTTPSYFYKPAGGVLTNQPALPDGGIVGARVIETSSMAHLVMSFADGKLTYKSIKLSDINGAIPWSTIPSRNISVPSGLGILTIFPESFMYQTTQPQDITFVVNGSNQEGLLYMIQGK